jgi:hypothetical protein
MLNLNFNGEDVLVLNDASNFKDGFKSSHELILDTQSSLTLRETRRAYCSKFRTTLQSSHVILDTSLLSVQGALRSLKAQPVLCPFWPAVTFWRDRAGMKISGGLLVAFKSDWSNYSVYENGDPEPGWVLDGDLICPILYGFLSSHKPKWNNASQSVYAFEFIENGPEDYSLTFVAGAYTAGPQPAGYGAAPNLLPFRGDFNRLDDDFSFEVNRVALEIARQQGASIYPHDVYRTNSASYTFTSLSDSASFLAFFETKAGLGAPFWGASGFEGGRVQNALLAGATALTLTNTSALVAGDYLCAYSANDSAHFAKVQAIVGNVVTLAAGFDVNVKAGSQLFLLCLARVDSPKLEIDWVTPALCTLTFGWVEVRSELVVAGDEILNVTLGKAPVRSVLFHLWRDYRNGTIVNWYFTSFGQDVTYGGHTYVGGSIWGCNEITQSLNLEDDYCDVEVSLVDRIGNLIAGNPLLDEVMATSEVPLNVEVLFADLPL